MQKGKIIKSIMGELLEPLGFTFKAIPKDKVWEFSRSIKNDEQQDIMQYVLIQEGQWDTIMYLNLRTSASGHGGWYRINRFVPGCIVDHLKYQTEDEFITIIDALAYIIQDFGLDFFELISTDISKEYLTNEHHIYLFNHHKELCERFLDREKIDISQLDFYQAVDMIEKIILDKKDVSFFEMLDLFLELSAFYGEILGMDDPVSWELEKMETSQICVLTVQFPKRTKKSIILNDIVSCWSFWRNGNIQRKLLKIIR